MACTNEKARGKSSRSPSARRAEYSKLNKELLFNKSREKLLASYGISVEEYDGMLAAQDGRCGICNQQETRIHHISGKSFSLAADLDHETGAVRGLLCTKCNKAVGALGDSHAAIARAIEYLSPWATESKG